MINKEITKKDLRQFGITLGLILALLGTIQYFKHHTSIYPWFFIFSVPSLLMGILFPLTLKPVYSIFIRIAHAIGWFNTRVILILLYYLILTPIGLVMRLFGKDLLNKKFDRTKDSYWIKRDTLIATKENLEKQF